MVKKGLAADRTFNHAGKTIKEYDITVEYDKVPGTPFIGLLWHGGAEVWPEILQARGITKDQKSGFYKLPVEKLPPMANEYAQDGFCFCLVARDEENKDLHMLTGPRSQLESFRDAVIAAGPAAYGVGAIL